MSQCVVCGHNKIHNDGRIEGYIADTHYTIFSCDTCSSKWSSPHQAEESVYNLIYTNRDITPGYFRYSQYAKEIKHKKNPLQYLRKQEEMYYGVLTTITKDLPQGSSILDLGCGLGYLTYALDSAGYKATGVDISSEAITEATKKYGNHFLCKDFFTMNESSDGLFDAICMLEFIEHVENPKQYIAHALTLLKPNGILILTTPNRSHFPKNALWDNELPPVHITWFSEDGMQRLVQQLGCTATQFSYTYYNLVHGSILTPTYKPHTRKPFFKKDGSLLFEKYAPYGIYSLIHTYGLYHFFKSLQKTLWKLKEFFKVATLQSKTSLRRSGIQCVIVRKN